MKKKIFIAINLTEKAKNQLVNYTQSDELAILPVKWIPQENLHITVEFLGYADDEQILEVVERLRALEESLESFSLFFDKITIGPVKDKPEMIWAVCQESEELNALNQNIADALSDIYFANRGKRYKFKAHITLGRIGREDMKDFKMDDLNINLPIFVESIELMESFKEGNKVSYAPLESIIFLK